MQELEYQEYSSHFSLTYKKAMELTLKEIKDFCVQIATAYSIIHLDQTDTIPKVKAVVYSPKSDTYYVHSDNYNFITYLFITL